MLKLFSIYAIISCVATVFIVSEPEPETNPFFDAAKSFLEDALEKNSRSGTNTGNAAASALDAILHTIRNSDAGKLGDFLSGFSAPNSKNVAGDVLAGIAGVLGKNSQNFNPKIVSQVGGILSSLASSNNDEVKDDNRVPDQQTDVNWGPIFGLVSDLISSANGGTQKDGGGGLDALLNLLPLLTGTGGASGGHVHFADNELEDENEHKRSADADYIPPPFMRIVHQYWDVFKKSEFGEAIWRKSGLEGIFQLFLDNDGYFQVDRIFESMENASFRRKWITSLSSFVGEWFKHLSDPITQARYMDNMKYLGNSFLKTQGYSDAVFFDPARPTDSFILITDAVFKKHFGLKIDSGKYARPAVLYIKDLFKLGDSKNFFSMSHLSSKDISSKLAELLNSELIEPILRVWKAYKYSLKHPKCDRRLICYLNDPKENSLAKTGLKPGVVKLSSLIASWYMSGRTGTPFWKLYNAATEEHKCEVQYPVDCRQFFEEDLQFTTESNAHSGEEL